MKTLYIYGSIAASSVMIAFNAAASDDITARSVMSQLHNDSAMTWSNAGPDEFESLLNTQFSVRSQSNEIAELNLIEIVPAPIDKHRPDFLPRKRAVTAVFEFAGEEASWLNEIGSQVVDIWHHELGNEKLFLVVTPRRNGGYSIEISFN